jgi:SAM-dependent methyltransferase
MEASFRGQTARALLTMMKQLSLRENGVFDPKAVQCALDAELVRINEGGHPVLTPLGWLVSDSIREYVFWLERDRLPPLYEIRPAFADALFRGKRVLEIGSGVGCNLFSLQSIASSVVGIEIEPVYVQMGPVLAKLAGVEPPLVHLGPAEHLPLGDASQDAVIALGSFQFMDFQQVLGEVSRVLDLGGLFVAMLSPLSLFVRYEIQQARNGSDVKRFLRTFLVAANTYHERWLGRRAGWFAERNPMNRAVYPTRRRMRRLLVEAGLIPDDASTEDYKHQRIYVAGKPK